MKFKFPLLFLLSSLLLFSCADDPDDSSPAADTNVFANPKTVLSSIDNTFSISSTQSSRAALAGDVDAGESLDASDSSNLYGIINSETEPRRLSGQVSTTMAILTIMKNDAASRMEGYGFGRKYTTPFQSEQFIEKSYMNITISNLEVRYIEEENAAYIYCNGTVPVDMGEGEQDIPYKFIMKCTKNETGTLDSELLMIMTVASIDIPDYSKFTCTNTEKVKLSYGIQSGETGIEEVWSKITITDFAITGYTYTKLGESRDGYEYKVAFYSDIESKLCATKSTHYDGSSGFGQSINYEDGQDVRGGGTTDASYKLNWLTIPSGWCIEKSDGDDENAYLLKKDSDSYSIKRCAGKIRNERGELGNTDNAVSFEIEDSEDNGKPVTNGPFTCKFSLTLLDELSAQADTLYESFPHESSSRETNDTTSLKTLLDAWS